MFTSIFPLAKYQFLAFLRKPERPASEHRKHNSNVTY